MEKKLSVVIPVYNLEKVILKTLNSLFSNNISTNHWEIIVVNDGSEDNTEKALQFFQKSKKVSKGKLAQSTKVKISKKSSKPEKKTKEKKQKRFHLPAKIVTKEIKAKSKIPKKPKF